jgi:hypothetical protein
MDRTTSFPDFLGIGAQKAATSWLYENLNNHPELWLPPAKELHYFSRSNQYLSRSTLACSRSLWIRFLGWNRADRSYKYQLLRTLMQTVKNPSLDDIRWHLKYFFGEYNDDWYASLFEEAKGRVCGEITPAYSLLDSKDVQHISTLIPKAKIIFLLRNPIDRIWSSIRYRYNNKNQVKNKSMTTLSSQEWVDLTSQPRLELRSNYLRTVSIWRKYFPEENFFVGFYDEVQENPEQLLLRLFNFLGVESDQKYISRNASQRHNASLEKEMPKDLKIHLAQKYYSEIKEMSNLLGSYATHWLREIETLEGFAIEHPKIK